MAKKSSGRSESSLHVGFAIGSFMLLATTLYVFIQDHYGREFPKYQDDYRTFELKRLSKERKEANAELGLKEFLEKDTELIASMDKYKAEVASKKADIEKLQGEAIAHGDKLSIVTNQLNAAKANFDEFKSQWDSGLLKHDDPTKILMQDKEKDIAAKAAEQYDWKAKQDAAKKGIADIQENLAKSKLKQDVLFAELVDKRVKMSKTAGVPIINFFKDIPGGDFVDPNYKIEQVVLNNLPWSVFFANTARVDRCVTCHKGIDNPDPAFATLGDVIAEPKPGETKVEYNQREYKVLKSHPRLDLFVGANSKHPYKKFGCTICHNGQPSAVTFNGVAHSPQNPEQQNYWRAKYGWESEEFWDAKMLPLQHTEAACAKCHKATDEVPYASKLNEGRHIFRDRGCVNCHFGTSGGPDMNWVGRVGPDLRRIGEKTQIDWARSWIENPWDFRPSTKMPRFFGLENHKDKAYEIDTGKVHARDAVESEAIAQYLFLASQLRETPQPPPKNGDVEEGRKLYKAVGCVGCHSSRDAAENDKVEVNQHGPDLSRIGEKVSAGWLFNWLKNPRHYWAETKMPNLRLSDDEAANLTTYLMSAMKSAKENPKALESFPAKAFEKIIIEKLASTTPEVIVQKRFEDPLKMVENALKLKVKYAVKLDEKGESIRYDTGDGEWSEPQIAKLLELLNKQQIPERRDQIAKAFYTGETLIQHYGCYGCHNIQGWTYAPLTCVNLSGEADKGMDKFDFGKAGHDHSIAETKWDWFFAKISRPRVFDRDKEELIKPFDRLRMPWFGYTNKDNSEHAHEHAAEPAKEGEHAQASEHGHGGKKYAPENNPDKSSPQVLGKHEVTRLVTFLLSLTNEVVPGEMQYQSPPKEIALDHGRRVIRELNCTGCHMASVGTGGDKDGSATLPMAAFVAFSTGKTRAFMKLPGNGIYSDDDLVSVDYPPTDVKIKGLVHIQRGTYLNDATMPILFEEYQVRTSPLLPWEQLNFKIEKKLDEKKLAERAAKGESWKPYGELVTEDEYIKLTESFYEAKYAKDNMKVVWSKFTDEDLDKIEGNYEKLIAAIQDHYKVTRENAQMQIKEKGKRDYKEAKAGYAELATQWVDVKAYERVAGTDALKLPNLKKEDLRSQRKFYDPVLLKVRFARTEGRIMNHIIDVEQKLYKNDNASQQQAPPSLSFEGGKIQPDWLYQFLHNVRELRPGLHVRMPSFWTDGPYSSYKTIYPAGRLSAVDPNKREKGVMGEPLPGPDATKLSDVPDDAQQVVDFFVNDANEKPYGAQPVLMDGNEKSLYALGKRYVTEATPDPAKPTTPPLVGIGCFNCHSVGNFEQTEKKWAPNLANVKRRLRDDWLRRFITFPPSLYPWTNMPNNFLNWSGDYSHELKNPTRGMAEGDETKLKEQGVKLEAVRFFLMHSGDAELGTDIKTAPTTPEKKN